MYFAIMVWLKKMQNHFSPTLKLKSPITKRQFLLNICKIYIVLKSPDCQLRSLELSLPPDSLILIYFEQPERTETPVAFAHFGHKYGNAHIWQRRLSYYYIPYFYGHALRKQGL
jgi:hypothetical protein